MLDKKGEKHCPTWLWNAVSLPVRILISVGGFRERGWWGPVCIFLEKI